MNAFLDKVDKNIRFKGLCSIGIIFMLLFQIFGMQAGAATVDANGNTSPIIVSMGDSYSSGEGIEPFYNQHLSNAEKVNNADWLAHRSEKSWAGMLEFPGLNGKTAKYKDKNWFFVAASGAETKHFNYEQKKEYSRGFANQISGTAYLAPQLDIFDQLAPNSVDYVTLTIGGNDAGFSDIITEAVTGSTYLNTSNLSNLLSDVWAKFYQEDGIRDDIYDCYKDIEEAAGPQAQIIVAGYPTLLEPTGKGLPISQAEAIEINRAVHNFNLELKKLVEHCADDGMKICFVSVEEEFAGREAYSKNPYINKVYILQSKPEDLNNFTTASAYSMHPNYDGAVAYAICVNKKIEALTQAEEERLEEEALNPSKKDREIVLVLDASGSMSGTPINETKSAAHKFVETVVEAQANVGVVYYDDRATLASALTDSQPYLDKTINQISADGGTNIEAGLQMADNMLNRSRASKKIIVLMSDGEPNNGKVGEELIAYADTLKEKGYYVYTLGFFSDSQNKTSAQTLMDEIASEGCHYEVSDADSLVYFFGDIADQISGEKYIYIRIACPVDVTVTHNGEKMTSKDNYSSVRTSFGSMTFEENKAEEDDDAIEQEEADVDNRIKILRLKEGVDYDIKIKGNGSGKMNYTIGFMDEDGEYSDMRRFTNVKITKKTKIDTVAKVSDKTYMYVDKNGDGEYDLTYKALENSRAEIVDNTYIIYILVAVVLLIAATIALFVLKRYFAIKKYL